MQKALVHTIGLLGVLALIAGFVLSPSDTASTSSDRLRVVASTSLVADWVRQVAGERVQLTVLAGPNASPHHLELAPSQVRALNRADLVVSIGNGLEPWLRRAYEGADSKAEFFELSVGLPLLARNTSPDDWIARPGMAVAGELPACCAGKYADLLPQPAVTLAMDERNISLAASAQAHSGCEGCESTVTAELAGGSFATTTHSDPHALEAAGSCCAAGGDSHAHGDLDPHVWMDVSLVRTMVDGLITELAGLDPANEAAYVASGEAYLDELSALDQWIFRFCQEVPDERRRLLTQHENMRYYAQRYGFALAGSLLGSLSTGEAGPSPFAVNRLLKRIEVQGIPAVFCENIASTRLAEQIAREAELGTPHVLITGALTDPGTEGDTYVGMMRHNTRTIVNALR
ncbi:MAG: metal ABC transporter substrate-binding protein [Opitutales bacterium]